MAVHYQSIVKKIQNIDLHKLDNNTTRNVVKIARVNHQMVAITKDGKLYTNSTGIKNAFYVNAWSTNSLNTIKCLLKLKLITPEDYKIHVEEMKKNQLASTAEYALQNLKDIAKDYDFELTEAQIKKIQCRIDGGEMINE